jgi:hypothetical protein
MNWMTSAKKRVQKRLSKKQQEQKLRLTARTKLLANPHTLHTQAYSKPLPQPYAELLSGGAGASVAASSSTVINRPTASIRSHDKISYDGKQFTIILKHLFHLRYFNNFETHSDANHV